MYPRTQPLESLVPVINQPGFTGKQPMLLEAINKVRRWMLLSLGPARSRETTVAASTDLLSHAPPTHAAQSRSDGHLLWRRPLCLGSPNRPIERQKGQKLTLGHGLNWPFILSYDSVTLSLGQYRRQYRGSDVIISGLASPISIHCRRPGSAGRRCRYTLGRWGPCAPSSQKRGKSWR